MSDCLPLWVQYIQALGPSLLGVGTAVIALLAYRISRQQSSTAKEKLKLDLFDRRYEVFSAVRDMFSKLTANGRLTPEEELAFLIGTRSASWLFSNELANYLDKDLWPKLLRLSFMKNRTREEMSEPDWKVHVEKEMALFQELSSELTNFESKVHPFMSIRAA